MELETKSLLKYLILPLALLTTAVFVANRQVQPDFLMRVHFYDTGGNGVLIQTYQGRQIVIDGGPTDAILQKLGHDLPLFKRQIDVLVLTSTKTDHIGGLMDILKRYQVHMVVLPEMNSDTGLYHDFVHTVDEKHVTKVFARTGQRIWLDSATVLDILSTLDLRLTFGQTHILFATGGVSKLFEKDIPKYAVIQVGKNTYGNQLGEILTNLHSTNTQIYRTDQDHDVEFISNGTSLYKN